MMTLLPLLVPPHYHPECQALVNNQINLELYASYVYLSMASYFNSNKVALKHLGHFFLQRSHMKREQVDRLVQLQIQRGGRVRPYDISMPPQDRWEDGLMAMECALNMEMRLNQRLLDLHELATNKEDGHLSYFLRSYCLQEQVTSIKELGDHVTKLRKMGAPESSFAVYLFDKLTLGHSDKKN